MCDYEARGALGLSIWQVLVAVWVVCRLFWLEMNLEEPVESSTDNVCTRFLHSFSVVTP